MADSDDILQEIDEAADQLAGEEVVGKDTSPLGLSQEHLDQAWLLSSAGTEVPAGASLRSVRKAALTVTRPVTSQQVPFNRELVSSVDQLLKAVRGLAHDVEVTIASSRRGTDRLQAAVATSDLAVDELTTAVDRLGAVCEDLLSRQGAVEAELAEARTELRSLRSRHDVVLRAAREAVERATGAGVERVDAAALQPLVGALVEDDHELAARLRSAVHGERSARVTAAAGPAGAFDGLDDEAVVVDLAAGAGELVEVLRHRHRTAKGVEANPTLVAEAQHLGLDVSTGDPLAHLAAIPAASIDGVAALGLPERLDGQGLVALLDGALEALRPGGVLVLDVTDPGGPAGSDGTLWADPAIRRPVAPDLVEVLALARGFAEAEQRGRPGPRVWIVARKAGTGA